MSLWRNTNFVERSMVSPNEQWAPGNSSVQRQVDILDGSFHGRLQAAYDFLGYANVIGDTPSEFGDSGRVGTGTAYIHRVIPMAYPNLAAPGFLPPPGDLLALPPSTTNKFFVVNISKTAPVAAPTGTEKAAFPPGTIASSYQRARMTLECSSLPYAILDDATLKAQGGINAVGNPDEGRALAGVGFGADATGGWATTRYITRHREAFSRIVTIPYAVMQTNAPTQDGKRKATKSGFPFREGGEYRVYTWMQVPLSSPQGISGVNFGIIEGSIGSINLFPFDGAATSTLLLDSVSSREYQGSFGEWLADITFNMIYLPHNSSGNRLSAFQNGNPGNFPAPPMNDDGVLLTLGTPTGWNTVIDVDYKGNWDYYDVTTAGAGYQLLGVNVDNGQPPFQKIDFSGLFRP